MRKALIPLLVILLLLPAILIVPPEGFRLIRAEPGRELMTPNPEVYPVWPLAGFAGTPHYQARTTGLVKILVVPIAFTDVSPTKSQSDIDNLLNNASPGYKSLVNYYTENSYGKLTIEATVLPWVYSSQRMSYYGADSSTGVDDLNGPIYRLATEAARLADPFVNYGDFAENGVVQHFIVVHAGRAQESSTDKNTIWSHHWAIADAQPSISGDQPLILDGVQIFNYIMASEFSPVGVFAHEFAHDLGLPDLYDTDGSSQGVGVWDLLGSGSWLGLQKGDNPAHLSSWSKIKLGWIEPVVVTSPLYGTAIQQVETNAVAYKLPIKDSTNGGEYFLMENREKVGFDSSLPGAGLLILHVDDSMPNNDVDTRRLVDVVEADGQDSPNDAGDLWANSPEGLVPGIQQPNTNAYDGSPTGWKVRNIGPAGAVMTVDISRDVDDDVAVAKISHRDIVSLGQTARITVTLANQGARNQTDVRLNITIYRDKLDLNASVFQDSGLVPSLLSGTSVNLSWQFQPSTKGRYIVKAFSDLPRDEIPENNVQLVHFTAVVAYFMDDVESGQGIWSSNAPPDRSYKWSIVSMSETYGDAHSPTQSWRFGFFGGSNTSELAYYTLTGTPVNISAGPLYLVFFHRYDFSARREANATETDEAWVQVSVNGGPWTNLDNFTGYQARWTLAYYNLSGYLPSGGTVRIRFNSTAQVMQKTGGWWIDDIALIATPLGYGVGLAAIDSERVVEPGSSALFRFKIVNLGDFTDSFVFSVSVPIDWIALLGSNITFSVAPNTFVISLGPDDEALLFLTIRSPPTVRRGTVVQSVVQATADNDPSQTSNFVVTTRINDPFGLGAIERYSVLLIVVFSVLVALVFIIDAVKRQRRGYYRRKG